MTLNEKNLNYKIVDLVEFRIKFIFTRVYIKKKVTTVGKRRTLTAIGTAMVGRLVLLKF
jgi:hypothetical protein